MYACAERTDDDAHDDRAAGDAELHGCAHARYGDRNHAERQTQEQSEEDGAEVRLVEARHGVAEERLCVVDVFGCAHDGDAVAVLQVERISCEQLDVAAHHSRHVHAVCLAHVQRAERSAVQTAARHHYHAALHRRVDGVPVYLVAVPVFLHMLAEEDVHGSHLVAVGHHEHVVAVLHHGLCHRNDNLSVAPDARDDEVAVGRLRYLRYRLVRDGGVDADELSDVCAVVVRALAAFKVFLAHEELAQQYHGEDDAHYAQRIGHGTTQCGAAARYMLCGKRLLSRTERRRIGRGTAEDAHHVGDADRQHEAQRERHHGAEHYDAQAPAVERRTVVAHHAYEVRTYVQTQGVDKEGEAEGFGEADHLLVGSEVEAARHDAHEEHERHAERDAADAQLAQRHAHADDQRQHYQRLYC